jgi:hypothetical protein
MDVFFHSLKSFIQGEAFFIALGALFLIELISRTIKRKLKRSIYAEYDGSIDPQHGEYYIEYYRRGQFIDVARIFSYVCLIAFLIASQTNSGANILVVVAGACIIIFRDFILSIVAFFFVLPQYKIGDTIGNETIQGQIIYIRLFSIGLLGKDNDGDNTGRHYTIPTYKLLTDTIRKEDLHASSIRKEILRIPFVTMDFSLSFSDFVTELETYLNALLPTLNRKSCGNYQTYIGHKYKIDFDYLEEKCVVITVGLV